MSDSVNVNRFQRAKLRDLETYAGPQHLLKKWNADFPSGQQVTNSTRKAISVHPPQVSSTELTTEH